MNIKNITTEKRNSLSRHLESKNTEEILNIINFEDAKITAAIQDKIQIIVEVTDSIFERVSNGGRLFYLGAGTSGRIGVLDASEMLPTYGIGDKIIGIIAGGDDAIKNPIEGAEDDENQSAVDLDKFKFNKKDVVLVIGASGRTPYCIGAIKHAKKMNAEAFGLAMSEDSEFSKHTKTIEIISGPEVVTGSTRMKAGTATKMVLNMISTTLMIKLGKVYDNLMINVKATNEKLVSRSIEITKEITKSDDIDLIIKLLNQSNFNIPIVSIAILNNVSIEVSTKMFEDNGNNWKGLI